MIYRPCLFIALTACLLLVSCTKEYPFLYRVTDLTLHNYDHSVADTALAEHDTIAALSYSIRMDYNTVIYSDDKTVSYESTSTLGHKPVRFSIYSLTAFDSTHAALASLNDYFLDNGRPIDSALLSSYLFDLAYPTRIHNRKVGETGSATEYLKLLNAPAAPGYRQFVVAVTFDDSTKLADTLAVTLR